MELMEFFYFELAPFAVGEGGRPHGRRSYGDSDPMRPQPVSKQKGGK